MVYRKKRKWVPTAEIDAVIKEVYQSKNYKIKATSVISKRTGWPAKVIQRRACELGIARPYITPKWTEAEIQLLSDSAYMVLPRLRTMLLIQCKTRRTLAAIGNKLHRLKARSEENRDWYSPLQLAGLLGVHHNLVTKWVEQGSLKGKKRGGRTNSYAIRNEDVFTFLRRHSTWINLCKVDRGWFLQVVSQGKIMERE